MEATSRHPSQVLPVIVSFEEMGMAYRAFLGDGDARTNNQDLMRILVPPFAFPAGKEGKAYPVPFFEFIDRNFSRVRVIEGGATNGS